MGNWVGDDVSFCALITGKLRVKYMVLNEAPDCYCMCSCTNHISSFIFSFLFLFPLKCHFFNCCSLVVVNYAVLVWNEECRCALERAHTYRESFIF